MGKVMGEREYFCGIVNVFCLCFPLCTIFSFLFSVVRILPPPSNLPSLLNWLTQQICFMCFQHKRTRQLPLPTPHPPPTRILKVKHGKLFLLPPPPQYFSSLEKMQHPVKSITFFCCTFYISRQQRQQMRESSVWMWSRCRFVFQSKKIQQQIQELQ